MKCPVDDTQLAITERQGVEIDYCPTCRGVWLDRGELDKLIERSENYQQAPRREERQEERYEERPRQDRERHYDNDDNDEHRDYRGREDHHDNQHGGKRRKKEGFLGDLFDF